MPKRWYSRIWVIQLLTGAFGLLMGAVGFVGTSALDQLVRNSVNEHMYEYAMKELLPTGLDEFQAMPIHWRQVIAEISIQRRIVGDADSRVHFATLEHFDVRNLHLVDKIAPYMIYDFLVRDPSQKSTRHPIPDMVYADFLDLESLGVLQSVSSGNGLSHNITSGEYRLHSGTHTVTVIAGQDHKTLEFQVTRVSEPWVKLIELLRVPTNIEYLDWFASRTRALGFRVDVAMRNQ